MCLCTRKTFLEEENITPANIRYQNLVGALPYDSSEYGKSVSCHESTRVTKSMKGTMSVEFTW